MYYIKLTSHHYFWIRCFHLYTYTWRYCLRDPSLSIFLFTLTLRFVIFNLFVYCRIFIRPFPDSFSFVASFKRLKTSEEVTNWQKPGELANIMNWCIRNTTLLSEYLFRPSVSIRYYRPITSTPTPIFSLIWEAWYYWTLSSSQTQSASLLSYNYRPLHRFWLMPSLPWCLPVQADTNCTK